jgi:hypothetical protein
MMELGPSSHFQSIVYQLADWQIQDYPVSFSGFSRSRSGAGGKFGSVTETALL